MGSPGKKRTRATPPRRKRASPRRAPKRKGGARPGSDPTALTVDAASRLLRVPAEAIRRHVDQGAPTDPEGRLNLIHYAAWLLRQLFERPARPS